jgi:hypothetical protein
MKKRYDPLWEIVGEKVSLQGEEVARNISCPRCRVLLGVPVDAAVGTVFCCGLCGATCRVVASSNAGSLTAEEVGKQV